MASDTAAEVYGFDLDALRPVAERCSPTLDELVTPLSPAPVSYSAVDYALGKVNGKETGRRLLTTMVIGSTPDKMSEGSDDA
jgi:hypothetical protein